MADITKRPDQTPANPAAAEVNFALVLSRMIDSVQQDPEQLRQTVYELARIKLREQFGHEDAGEIKRLVGALETAIEGVEMFSLQQEDGRRNEPPKALRPHDEPELLQAQGAGASSQRRPLRSGGEVRAILDSSAAPLRPDAVASRSIAEPHRVRPFAAMVRLVVVLGLIVAVAAGIALWPRLRPQLEALQFPTQRIADSAAALPKAASPTEPRADVAERLAAVANPAAPNPGFPLPTTFGIYAISDAQLFELRPLPGRIPDQRVAVSAAITTPSQTTIASGDAKFIVFRRDSASNAPDHTEVRAVAKIVRAMGFDPSSKTVVSQSPDNWVIRNISFPYKTGPVDDHPEMFLIQPETPDQVLPPGRYALVIKGQGFDFTVAGPITDPRQCLERVDAANGAFYSPCSGK